MDVLHTLQGYALGKAQLCGWLYMRDSYCHCRSPKPAGIWTWLVAIGGWPNADERRASGTVWALG